MFLPKFVTSVQFGISDIKYTSNPCDCKQCRLQCCKQLNDVLELKRLYTLFQAAMWDFHTLTHFQSPFRNLFKTSQHTWLLISWFLCIWRYNNYQVDLISFTSWRYQLAMSVFNVKRLRPVENTCFVSVAIKVAS